MPRTRRGVEIARTGTYELSSGTHTFTREQLAAAVRNHATGAAPRLGIGHVDRRFDVAAGSDGEPAIGSVTNLRLNETGDVLLGDFVNVPDWLDDAMETAYPGRSLEGTATETDLRLTGVRLLGYTRPGIHTLADLRSFIEDGPALVAAGSDNEGHTFTVLLAAAAPATSTPEEEPSMTDEQRRNLASRLGLPEDATEDQIFEAAARAPEEPRREPEVRTEPATTTEPERDPAAREPAAEQAPEPAALAAAAAEITRLSTQLADLQARDAERERRETTERRNQLVASAVQEGRIAPADRDHYRRLLDADETVGTALIQARARGTVPLAAEGHGEDIAASGETNDGGLDTTLCTPQQIAALRERGLIKETV